MVCVQEVQLAVGVAEGAHLLESIVRQSNLRNERLETFAHDEHWEVVALLFSVVGVLVVYVLEDGAEGLLVLPIGNSFVTVT